MNNKENYPTWLVFLDIVKELKEIGFNKKTMFYFFSGNTTFKCSISEDIPLDYIHKMGQYKKVLVPVSCRVNRSILYSRLLRV